MGRIKKFADFVLEGKSVKIIPAGDEEQGDGSDKETEAEVTSFMDAEEDNCPRCGEHVEDCRCDDSDYWSTQTYHRVPKGKVEKPKPKQNFKDQ